MHHRRTLLVATTVAMASSCLVLQRRPSAVLTFSKLGGYGRLGNQLFQIASVYGMAKTLGVPALFPSIPPNLEEAFQLTGIARGQPSPSQEPTRIHYVEHPTALVYPTGPLTGVIDCRGYFQHQDYFRHAASDIRTAFRARPHMLEKVAPLVTPHTIGIHIRRGDYKDVLPPTYYRDAVAHIRGRRDLDGSRTTVLVCSDDVEWCRGALDLDPEWDVTWSPLGRDVDDLVALMRCPGLVMSNSTFSWWAAWLGDHPLGVVMPWPWFGSADAWDNVDAPSWNVPAALVHPSWTVWKVPRDDE